MDSVVTTLNLLFQKLEIRYLSFLIDFICCCDGPCCDNFEFIVSKAGNQIAIFFNWFYLSLWWPPKSTVQNVAWLPRSGKNRESQGIRKLRSRPLKVREFQTFYSKSGKSPWILYHLGSIRIIFVPGPTSVLHICFPILTVHSHRFCGPILRGANLTGPHYGLSSLDIIFPNSLWYQCNYIAARPTPRLRQPQLWGEESGVYK